MMKKLFRIAFTFTMGMLVLFAGTAFAELVIDQNYQLVSKTRAGRTVYDYTYKVSIINNDNDAYNVTATLTSNLQETVVIDGNVNFGSVPAGDTITSTDTFTIRQDRRVPFNPSLLVWDINFLTVNLPPDPGEAGKETVLGVDSDSDGVRDDIQRYIHYTYPENEKVRVALTQMAKEYQGILSQPNNHDVAFDHATIMARHGECLFYIQGESSLDARSALKAAILNTGERSRAYITYSNTLGGEVILGAPIENWKNSCNFNVDEIGENN